MPDYVLVHHGIKGMKWGVRRFQNKDGSLTAAGRARQRLQDAADQRKARKEEEARAKADKALRKKPISKLTEDEIRARISRLELEKKLVDLEKNTQERAETPSRVKSFMSVVGKEVVKPAVINAARNTLQNYLNGVGGKMVKNLLKDATGGDNNNGNNNSNKPKKNRDKKPKTEDKPGTDNKPKTEDKPTTDSSTKPTSNPVNKPQKPFSTEKTVDADYKDTSPQRSTSSSQPKSSSTTSNSNARSTHEVFKEMFPNMTNTKSTSVSDLSKSGYHMRTIESGQTVLDRMTNSGWTMRSLDDLEKYN